MSCRILMRQNASQIFLPNRIITYEVNGSQFEAGRYYETFVSCRDHSTKCAKQPKIPLPKNYFITTPIYYLNAGTLTCCKMKCITSGGFRFCCVGGARKVSQGRPGAAKFTNSVVPYGNMKFVDMSDTIKRDFKTMLSFEIRYLASKYWCIAFLC